MTLKTKYGTVIIYTSSSSYTNTVQIMKFILIEGNDDYECYP